MVACLRRDIIIGGLGGLAFARSLRANAWPERPITWIVPFPPGSSADTYAKPLAAVAGSKIGQPIEIDYRTGAGGSLAATLFTRSAPDGYSLLVGYTGLLYAPIVYPRAGAGFDFARDFTPVCAFAREPLVLVINPELLRVANLREFITAAQRQPHYVEVGSDGLGTVSHLAISLLEERASIDLLHVPLRGTRDVVFALLHRRLGAAFLPAGVVAAHETVPTLKVLAVAGRRRSDLFPEVPTFEEIDLDFRVSQWFGLFSRVGTPASVLDLLHDAVQAGLENEAVKTLWAKLGARAELETREDFSQFVAQETVRWSRLARAANLQLD